MVGAGLVGCWREHPGFRADLRFRKKEVFLQPVWFSLTMGCFSQTPFENGVRICFWHLRRTPWLRIGFQWFSSCCNGRGKANFLSQSIAGSHSVGTKLQGLKLRKDRSDPHHSRIVNRYIHHIYPIDVYLSTRNNMKHIISTHPKIQNLYIIYTEFISIFQWLWWSIHQVTVVPFAFRWPKQPSNPKLAASPEFYDHQRTVPPPASGGGGQTRWWVAGGKGWTCGRRWGNWCFFVALFLWIFGFGDKEPGDGWVLKWIRLLYFYASLRGDLMIGRCD